jgi:hypothetical protein
MANICDAFGLGTMGLSLSSLRRTARTLSAAITTSKKEV